MTRSALNESLPAGIDAFLAAAGWGGADIAPLPGDASFRRYFRLSGPVGTALLMDAPPPHEDPRPFLHVGGWLLEQGLRAPQILAADAARGLVLIEDFGTDRMRDWLDENPAGEDAVYRAAIDALVRLHACPPGPFDPYDMAVYQREAGLFTEWYCPAMGLVVDAAGYRAAWDEVLAPMMDRQQPGVTVLRDYHAENIMLLPPIGNGEAAQGIIDFQDALVGHPAYDLVSLLQDARRDVDPALERRMLDVYLAQTGAVAEQAETFCADYARLGAQRNAKIVGIFARLHRRDGKPRYLSYIPRVWAALERDLAHPALAPVAQWFDRNVPGEIRIEMGGSIA